jgi:hypothetical protein
VERISEAEILQRDSCAVGVQYRLAYLASAHKFADIFRPAAYSVILRRLGIVGNHARLTFGVVHDPHSLAHF